MNSGRPSETDVIHDDHRPGARRHILEFLECIDGGGDVPDGCQIARRLLLQGRRDAHHISQSDTAGFRHESELLQNGCHEGLPLSCGWVAPIDYHHRPAFPDVRYFTHRAFFVAAHARVAAPAYDRTRRMPAIVLKKTDAGTTVIRFRCVYARHANSRAGVSTRMRRRSSMFGVQRWNRSTSWPSSGISSAATCGCGQSVPQRSRSGLARSNAVWNGRASG